MDVRSSTARKHRPTAISISATGLAKPAYVLHLSSLAPRLPTRLYLLLPTEREWWRIFFEIDFGFPRFADIVRRFGVAIRDIPCLAKEFDGLLLASEILRRCVVRHSTSLLVDFSYLRVKIYRAIARRHGG